MRRAVRGARPDRREQARDTEHHAETWRLPPRGNSGWRSWGAEPIPWRRAGRPKGETPPPRCSLVPHPVLASCLRRACDMRATKGQRQGHPPPHTPPPPRGCARRVGEAKTGDTQQAPPLQRDKCRASCLRHACVVPTTCVLRRKDDKGAPPPHTHLRHPKGGGCR